MRLGRKNKKLHAYELSEAQQGQRNVSVDYLICCKTINVGYYVEALVNLPKHCDSLCVSRKIKITY